MPNCIDTLIDRAERLCRKRQARLTPQRRFVLEAIAAAHQPQSAYEILGVMRRRWPKAAPPTVYRALEFLQQQGLVHRLATMQAFVTCVHPGQDHAGQFLICRDCGRVEELDDGDIESSLGRAASAAGFRAAGEVVELTGRCCDCQEKAGS
jgi:Fur family zinc uptake transcriptional regulator